MTSGSDSARAAGDPPRDRKVFKLASAILGLVLALAFCEALTLLAAPQAIRVPRSVWSQAYGMTTLPNTRTVDTQRGVYRFEYTSNAQGFRGEFVPASERDGRTRVVLLGDSYTFGYGVNDEDVYGTLLANELRATHTLVNLGSPGFGLGQEIRLFHDVGASYEPSVVVLQWHDTDLSDDLRYPVTEIVQGRFEFHDLTRHSLLDWAKTFLSDSVLQRSQLYSLVRLQLYAWSTRRQVAQQLQAEGTAALDGGKYEERRYAEKLALFAQELATRGVRLLFLPVHGQLAARPELAASLEDLGRRGLLLKLPTESWFEGLGNVRSPEGHAWGAKAHHVIAQKLTTAIRGLDAIRPGAASVSTAPVRGDD